MEDKRGAVLVGVKRCGVRKRVRFGVDKGLGVCFLSGAFFGGNGVEKVAYDGVGNRGYSCI